MAKHTLTFTTKELELLVNTCGNTLSNIATVRGTALHPDLYQPGNPIQVLYDDVATLQKYLMAEVASLTIKERQT